MFIVSHNLRMFDPEKGTKNTIALVFYSWSLSMTTVEEYAMCCFPSHIYGIILYFLPLVNILQTWFGITSPE